MFRIGLVFGFGGGLAAGVVVGAMVSDAVGVLVGAVAGGTLGTIGVVFIQAATKLNRRD